MSLFGVCMTFNIYYLLLRLSNVIFIEERPAIEEELNSVDKLNLTSHLLCPNFNCKSQECRLDNSIGARVCSSACTDGWRGSTCQHLCPRNCIRCNKYSGVCNTCRAPWSGIKCTLLMNEGDDSEEAEVKVHHGRRLHSTKSHCLDKNCTFCEKGWFGEDCSDVCPENCYSGCEKMEGYCDHGCKDGFYGRLCKESCSRHCRKGCNQTTADCFEGCAGGFFGPRCTMTCITTCDNGVCDRRSGICSDTTTETTHVKEGCPEGFYGLHCEKKLKNTHLDMFYGVLIGVVITLCVVLPCVCYKRRIESYMRYLNLITETSSDSEDDDLHMSECVVTQRGMSQCTHIHVYGISKKRQPTTFTA